MRTIHTAHNVKAAEDGGGMLIAYPKPTQIFLVARRG